MITFTKNEVRDLLIAFIVLSFCFAIATVKFDLHGIISLLPIVMVGVGLGFIFRDLGQKYVAMKYGYGAEFELWPSGLVIAFITALIGIVFAFPGDVKITPDNLSDELCGRITIAGPMANMALALVFLVIAALLQYFSNYSNILHLFYLICTIGFSVNTFLATFNMLPIWSLDGIKVLKWSPKYWFIVFAIGVIMTILSITIGAENMVKMIIGI